MVMMLLLFILIFQISDTASDANCTSPIEYKSQRLWTKENVAAKNYTISAAECATENGSLYLLDSMKDLQTIGQSLCLNENVGYYINTTVYIHKQNNNPGGNKSGVSNAVPVVDPNKTCFIYNSSQLTPVDCSTNAQFICQKEMSQSVPSSNQSVDLDKFAQLMMYVLSKVNTTSSCNNTNVTDDGECPGTKNDCADSGVTMSGSECNTVDITNNATVNATATTVPAYKGIKSALMIQEVNLETDQVNEIATDIQTRMNTSNEDRYEVMQVLAHISKVKVTNIQTVKLFTSVVTGVLSSFNGTRDPPDTETKFFSDVFQSMENVVESSNHGNNFNISSTEIDYKSEIISRDNSTSNDTCKHVKVENRIGRILFPVFIFIGHTIQVSTIVYHSVHEKMPVKPNTNGERTQLGSKVVSVSLQRVNGNTTEKLTIYNMDHACEIVLPTDINGREKKRFCTFWNYTSRSWDNKGSTVKKKNNTHTTCVYNHLTNLAVLVLYYDEHLIGSNEERTLMILTSVGCSLSITCLSMTLVVYAYLRVLTSEKILIHSNLAFSLLLAQLVVVTSQGAEHNPMACKAVALLLHFFFMSAFTWMLMEGLALYLACTKGLHNYGDMRWKYCLIGWGLPVVIVMVSFGAEFQDYGNGAEHSCWLSTKNGLIWAFMGPMFVIVTLNVFVLGLVMKVFLTLKAVARKSEAAKLRASFKTMVTLLPLLGFTWLLSILVPINNVFHYLFVIGNSMQGMLIFFLHCACNDEVRKKFMEKRRLFSSTGRSTSETELTGLNHRRALRFQELKVVLPKIPKGRRHAWI